MKLLNIICIALFNFVRPFLGPASCKFTISCGNFAIMQLQDQSFFVALAKIVKRIISCNPFYTH